MMIRLAPRPPLAGDPKSKRISSVVRIGCYRERQPGTSGGSDGDCDHIAAARVLARNSSPHAPDEAARPVPDGPDILLASLHNRSKSATMGKEPVELSPGNHNVK